MKELKDNSVQLVVTSPPYFNVKDYGTENIGSLNDFEAYLKEIQQVFDECYRVLDQGRYICVNISDIISNKEKYPIPAHFVFALKRAGFDYREDIIWRKPSGIGSNGGSGAGRRFGVLIQNPYPMYYFPNNVFEHILVFRKGKFDYKGLSLKEKKAAELDVDEARERWNTDIWDMCAEMHNNYPGMAHPAMFPEQLPEAFIRLYSFEGETVLDPFLGSGTTSKVAAQLKRRSIGYEINPDFLPVIKRKTGIKEDNLKVVFQRGD